MSPPATGASTSVTTAGAPRSGVICEVQHKVGLRGGREEEVELERRDSDKEQGKTTTKPEPNKHEALTGRDEVHVLAERVEQEPLEAGGDGDRVRVASSECSLLSFLPQTRDGERKMAQAPTHGSPMQPSLGDSTGTRPGECPQTESGAWSRGLLCPQRPRQPWAQLRTLLPGSGDTAEPTGPYLLSISAV